MCIQGEFRSDSLEVKAFNFNHECLSECLHVGSPQNVGEKMQQKTWSLDKNGASFAIFISFFQFAKPMGFGFCWLLVPEMMERWKLVRCCQDIIDQCGVSLWLVIEGHNLARLFQEVGDFSPEVTDRFLTGCGGDDFPMNFFPIKNQLLKMSPKVRDWWYRIVLFPTVETTLRTVAEVTLRIWHWVGVQLHVLNVFFLYRMVVYPSFLVFFCWQRSHRHPRHRAGCLTPKALPPLSVWGLWLLL